MGIGFDPARAEFLCDLLAPTRLTRIVDIGANPINDNPYSGLLALGRCDVWGFEPQQVAYEKLKDLPQEHAHYLPYAVGDDGKAELKVTESSGYASLLEPNVATFDALGRFHEGARVIERVEVETRTLDSIEEVPDFDLLKIDVQGSEVAVFDGAKDKLSNAIAVITEMAGTPIYVDQPLFDQQMSRLRALGFDFHKFFTISSFSYRNRFADRMHMRKFRSQFVDGDAVFVRDILNMAALETEQLKHLAILADAVFDSQDVSVAAMSFLNDRNVLSEEQVHAYLDRLPFVTPRKVEA